MRATYATCVHVLAPPYDVTNHRVRPRLSLYSTGRGVVAFELFVDKLFFEILASPPRRTISRQSRLLGCLVGLGKSF